MIHIRTCHKVTQTMYISMNRVVVPDLMHLKFRSNLPHAEMNEAKFLHSEVISSDLISTGRKMCELLFRAPLRHFSRWLKQ